MVDKNDIDNFLASHTYSQETKHTYKDIIPRVLNGSIEVETLTATELLGLIEKQDWGNARQCLGLAATQKYIRWKYGDAHPALLAKIKRQKGGPQRSLDEDTALKLLASFNPYRATGARNLAIATLAIDTGLRVSEICRVQIRHVDFKDLSLQVLVKGGKWEYAIFSPQTAAHVQHWLSYRKSTPSEDWLFTSTFTGEKLTSKGLTNIIKSWGSRIGIKLSPHDLRRTFATLSTEAGAPERVLMAGGRWESSAMIIRYTRTLRLKTMRKYLPVPKILE